MRRPSIQTEAISAEEGRLLDPVHNRYIRVGQQVVHLWIDRPSGSGLSGNFQATISDDKPTEDDMVVEVTDKVAKILNERFPGVFGPMPHNGQV